MTSIHPKVCPACALAMRLVHEGSVEIDFCDGCHAVWLDRGELKSLLSLPADWNPNVTDQACTKNDISLACPTCECEELCTISRRGFDIRVCSGCRGTLIDSETLDRLVRSDSGALTGDTMKSVSSAGFTIEALVELLAFFVSH